MVSIEQVEKLLQYADISYEEARDALESCGGNLLDAIVLLERQGRIRGGKGGAVTVLPGSEQERESYGRPNGGDFADAVKRFLKWIGETFDSFIENVARRDGADRGGAACTDERRRDGESEKL